MTPQAFDRLQPGDRVVVRFRRGEQFAVVLRRASTTKGRAVWLVPFDKTSRKFYPAARRVAAVKVIRMCAADEFTIPYHQEGLTL